MKRGKKPTPRKQEVVEARKKQPSSSITLKSHHEEAERITSARSIDKVISDIEDLLDKAQERKCKIEKPARRNAMGMSGSKTSNEYYVLRQSLALPDNASKAAHHASHEGKGKIHQLRSKASSHFEQPLQLLSVRTLQDKMSSTFPSSHRERKNKEDDEDAELRNYTRVMFKTAMEERERSNLRKWVKPKKPN